MIITITMRMDRDEAAKELFVYESASRRNLLICMNYLSLEKIFCIPANSAPVERKWIIHAATLWCARSRMGNKLLSELMTITK